MLHKYSLGIIFVRIIQIHILAIKIKIAIKMKKIGKIIYFSYFFGPVQMCTVSSLNTIKTKYV